MPPIHVLVAATSQDLKAEFIALAVAAHPDMTLVARRCVKLAEVDALLESIPAPSRCALVLVGPPAETDAPAQRWLAARVDLVVMHVAIVDEVVRITLHDPRLDHLLTALRGLVENVGDRRQERVARVQLRAVPPPPDPNPSARDQQPVERSLLRAAIAWIHELLRDAVQRVPDDDGGVHGFSVTKATLVQSLDAPARAPDERPQKLADVDEALDRAREAARTSDDPLAIADGVFALEDVEFRAMLLALAPELDLRYQRCIGFLLDEMVRRTGTTALYASLLGAAATAGSRVAVGARLTSWRVFEGGGDGHAADEPLRLDPFLTRWLLGDRGALANDARVLRLLRPDRWRGASLLQRCDERSRAERLSAKLRDPEATHWILLGGDDPAGWRALLELPTDASGEGGDAQLSPMRVEAQRLGGMDIVEIDECGRRLGRMQRLTRRPLVVDVPASGGTEGEDDLLRRFLASLADTKCQAAIIGGDAARIVQLLGSTAYEWEDAPALKPESRVAAIRAAAEGAEAYLTSAAAEEHASRFPLPIDGLEHAMRLAQSRPKDYTAGDPRLARFIMACKDVAAEGISHLADRIEPVFELDQVVLPADRRGQLVEIVDNVRLASKVLDDWKFRAQLPYGRGVTALFFGASGTGKTMAAIGIASRLGIQLLRLDLSRVVSKYIGETEKNLDRVFTDAQRSGSMILIDEADALLGKRSEVKDAHDRYANIEVAFLLQRMEAFDGLAILTTNMRQNLDQAFLRRLRFVVDFPRPDVDAREQIWRQCFSDGSHALDAAACRQLARKIDLTGGHIRQITLRAAFMAAAAGTRITLEHVANAARAELAKLGMPAVDLDPAGSRQAA